MTYDPDAGELLPDGSRIQTTTAGELADWMARNGVSERECHSTYAQAGCPDRCGYATGNEKYRDHSHWRCGDHGHTWVYFPTLGQVDWFDLSQPSRLIYPAYAKRGRRGRGE